MVVVHWGDNVVVGSGRTDARLFIWYNLCLSVQCNLNQVSEESPPLQTNHFILFESVTVTLEEFHGEREEEEFHCKKCQILPQKIKIFLNTQHTLLLKWLLY